MHFRDLIFFSAPQIELMSLLIFVMPGEILFNEIG